MEKTQNTGGDHDPPQTETATGTSVPPAPDAPRAHDQTARSARRTRLIVQVAVLLMAIVGVGTAFAARQMTKVSSDLAMDCCHTLTSRTSPQAADGSTVRNLINVSERDAQRMNWLFLGQAAASVLLAGLVCRSVGREWTQRQQQEAQLQEINARLQEQAETDELTCLKNRRAFEYRLQEEWARARRYGHELSLLFIDVDYFKRFNDTWGHLAGDDTLRQTAVLLQAQSRVSDVVARYGGEEFVLLLPHTSEAAALVLADRIRAAFSRHQWGREAVTVSIGVASLTPEMRAPTDLVHEADNAHYLAKQRGRDRTVAASTT